MLAWRALARRYQHLDAEVALLTEQLDTAKHAAALRGLRGVGPDSAAALPIAAGDNPQRLRSEAAFAALCGSSRWRPPPARPTATGSTAADRQANAAMHRIVVVRPRWHQPTRDYAMRRTAQGRTSKESPAASSATQGPGALSICPIVR